MTDQGAGTRGEEETQRIRHLLSDVDALWTSSTNISDVAFKAIVAAWQKDVAAAREQAQGELWAARVNADESMQAASEAWARCAELVEMLEGRKPVDQALLAKLKAHWEHVVSCRKGSCEHEYAGLVRAGLIQPLRPGGAPDEGASHG